MRISEHTKDHYKADGVSNKRCWYPPISSRELLPQHNPLLSLGCVLLAVGALTIAAGGSLTRLGHSQFLYMAMSPGVALMFWGYLKTIRPAPVLMRSAMSSQEAGQTKMAEPIATAFEAR